MVAPRGEHFNRMGSYRTFTVDCLLVPTRGMANLSIQRRYQSPKEARPKRVSPQDGRDQQSLLRWRCLGPRRSCDALVQYPQFTATAWAMRSGRRCV